MFKKTAIFATDSREKLPAACVFVLFGATGDLAARKIAPALYNLMKEGLVCDDFAVVGVARRSKTDHQFRQNMLYAIQKYSRSQPVDMELWEKYSERWFYQQLEASSVDDYKKLALRLEQIDPKYGKGCLNRLIYLAVSPQIVGQVSENLAQAGLGRDHCGGYSRIIYEKPFGFNLESAQKLNHQILLTFDESQVYRIDHYLGKETVQNILVFRFANTIIEPLWNRNHIDRVEITVAETVGMEGRRGSYYDHSGAMRDMVQNHILQLLALTAMEVPSHLGGDAIRDEKVKVFKSIKPLTPKHVLSDTVRAQYVNTNGMVDYRKEEGVAQDSQTETFAALKLYIDNWRWAGVPFFLRTGKRMAEKSSRIVITFKREPISLFDGFSGYTGEGNSLEIRITPDEGIGIIFYAKVPSSKKLIQPVKMDFSYKNTFAGSTPEAYEHLLLDVMRGDHTQFIRNDEVEKSWSVVDRVLDVWENENKPELLFYPCGSWGPDQADIILQEHNAKWNNP